MASREAGHSGERDALETSALSLHIGLAVRLLDVRLMKRANEAFGNLGLTPASATALLLAQANPGARHGELADALLVQRPNMTKLLRQLVEAGWLRREGSDGDRRHVMFTLTKQGENIAARARQTMTELDDLVMADLNALEQEVFADLVRRISRSFDPAVNEGE